MTNPKKRILFLVEQYASASRQDELAGMRDAPAAALKRHYDKLTTLKSDIERELDSLIERAGVQ